MKVAEKVVLIMLEYVSPLVGRFLGSKPEIRLKDC